MRGGWISTHQIEFEKRLEEKAPSCWKAKSDLEFQGIRLEAAAWRVTGCSEACGMVEGVGRVTFAETKKRPMGPKPADGKSRNEGGWGNGRPEEENLRTRRRTDDAEEVNRRRRSTTRQPRSTTFQVQTQTRPGRQIYQSYLWLSFPQPHAR